MSAQAPCEKNARKWTLGFHEMPILCSALGKSQEMESSLLRVCPREDHAKRDKVGVNGFGSNLVCMWVTGSLEVMHNFRSIRHRPWEKIAKYLLFW